MSRLSAILPGLAFLLISGVCISPPAEAGQFFVHPTLGSDSNPGTSPALPFQHIRKALQAARSSGEIIHLAPGEYGAASGELFPLPLGATRLVGDGGSAVTHIVGTGDDILFDALSPGVPGGTILDLEGLHLAGGRTGLRLNSPAHVYAVVLKDLAISAMSQDGIEAHAIPVGAPGSQLNLFLTQVSISDCLRGLSFEATSPLLTSVVSVVLCDFRGNAAGLDLVSSGDLVANVTMSRFEENGLFGLRAFGNGGLAQLEVSSSLIARNAVGLSAGGIGGEVHLAVQACTVAGNTLTGIDTDLPTPPASTTIESTILWGNAQDVALAGPVTAQFNDAEGGDFGTINGNLSADPLFRDAAGGDYRLSWGSPAIEAGGELPAFDLLGNLRPVDGDLDAESVIDMGCLEFLPLELISPAQKGVFATLPLGGTLRLEAWGAPGATAALFVSPQQIVFPFVTGFGLFFLNPAQFLPLGTLPAGPATPGVLQAVVPTQPALAGLALSFQALTTSALAPKGAALSSAVQCGLVP